MRHRKNLNGYISIYVNVSLLVVTVVGWVVEVMVVAGEIGRSLKDPYRIAVRRWIFEGVDFCPMANSTC